PGLLGPVKPRIEEVIGPAGQALGLDPGPVPGQEGIRRVGARRPEPLAGPADAERQAGRAGPVELAAEIGHVDAPGVPRHRAHPQQTLPTRCDRSVMLTMRSGDFRGSGAGRRAILAYG